MRRTTRHSPAHYDHGAAAASVAPGDDAALEPRPAGRPCVDSGASGRARIGGDGRATITNTRIDRGGAMHESGGLQLSSMRSRCSAAEWQARVDLAACYRLVELYGMSDMMANHISSRVPGRAERLPHQRLRDDVRGDHGLEPDQGRPRRQDPRRSPTSATLDYGINKAGYVIHSAVHARAPRGGLRHPHPQLGVDGGLVAGVRPAADHADGDALPEDRLSRLPGRGARRRASRRRCSPTWARARR